MPTYTADQCSVCGCLFAPQPCGGVFCCWHPTDKGISISDPRHRQSEYSRFMSRRPPKGNAFFCANDLLMLVHMFIVGAPDHKSPTVDRSLQILSEAGLIAIGNGIKDHEDFITHITEKGRALVERLIDTRLEFNGYY